MDECVLLLTREYQGNIFICYKCAIFLSLSLSENGKDSHYRKNDSYRY